MMEVGSCSTPEFIWNYRFKKVWFGCLVCVGGATTNLWNDQKTWTQLWFNDTENLQVWEPSSGLVQTYYDKFWSPPAEDVPPESPIKFLMPSDSPPTLTRLPW